MNQIKQDLELKIKDMKECSKQISRINKQTLPFKNKKKELKAYIISKMEEKGMTDLEVDGIKYVLETTKKSAQIRAECIRTTLNENGIKDVNKIIKAIQDKLDVKQSVSLKKK